MFLTALVLFLTSTTKAYSRSGSKPKEAPLVGRKAAAKYLARTSESEGEDHDEKGARPVDRAGEDLLALGVGPYLNSQSYNWGGFSKLDDVGKISYGVTYLFEEWNKFDVSFRMDFNEYRLEGDRTLKLSLLPMLTFPQANRHFPLYFGAGAGLGVYFIQFSNESNISFDYQLVAGARFVDVFENTGFFAELAMKNHFHLTSQGQFNGVAVTFGAVFSL
ncbi:MAG: hypothetical protein C5B49_15800 [Bdellovibrio sp.]|nr:MAG: hypothetical protein C5B49_15800 [Bdellovibrio sp.]